VLRTGEIAVLHERRCEVGMQQRQLGLCRDTFAECLGCFGKAPLRAQ
jgi:hypothetical protein